MIKFLRKSLKLDYLNNPRLKLFIHGGDIDYEEILEVTKFLPEETTTMRQRTWHIINNKFSDPICCCGNKTSWQRQKNTYSEFCSIKCMSSSGEFKEKIKKTNLEKYGSSCYLHSTEGRKKVENRNLERYGTKNAISSVEIRDKIKKTNLERYGVENAMSSDVVQRKTKATNLERYGVENFACSDVIRNKIKKTNLERYGVETPLASRRIKDKIKKTNLERYGVETPFHRPEIQEKIKIHFLEEYKRSNPSQSHIPIENINKMKDKSWWEKEHLIDKKPLFQISEELGVSPSLSSKYLSFHGIPVKYFNISNPESKLLDFIKSIYDGEITTNCRSLISPKEIDIYLPDLNLAFEFDGIYWHSESAGKDKNYHLNKTKICSEQGIHLVHVFESEWELKQDVVKSRIRNLLGLSEKIYARKCEIREVSTKEKRGFLINSHIQGDCPSSVNLGLYYENELVSLMSFGKSRFNKQYEWELIRYCNKLGTSIVGGASRLIKRFIKGYNPISVISYSDKRWNTGKLYINLGFEHSHTSKPNFFYFKNSLILESRQKYQKHKQRDILEHFDPNITANMNMQNNGYNRIWDCGNDVYTLLLNPLKGG